MAPEKLCGAVDRKKPWTSLCLIDIYASALVAYEIMSRCSFSMNTVYQGTILTCTILVFPIMLYHIT